jgi:murein L,D-transpeptidase YafK
MHRVKTALLVLFACAAAMAGTTAQPKVDRIVIVKSDHTMALMSGGRALKSYKVALGNPKGAKKQAGDRQTPEGVYVIDSKNAHSRFHRALHISYPNQADRERARKLGVTPGGDIEIHGLPGTYAWLGWLHRFKDWTAGCIAVTNSEIDEIYSQVEVGTPVEIKP